MVSTLHSFTAGKFKFYFSASLSFAWVSYPAREAGPDDGKVSAEAKNDDDDVEDDEDHVPVVRHPKHQRDVVFVLVNLRGVSREYWMIYRGPCFLAVVTFGSSTTPFPPFFRQQVVALSQSSCVSLVELTD